MRTRSLQLAMGVLLLLIAIFGITPRVVGSGIKDATVTELIELIPPETRSQLDIEEIRFSSGWFRTSTSLEVKYRPIGVEELALRLDFDIQHGPLLIARDGIRLGLAYAEIRPTFNNPAISEALTEIPFELPDILFELTAGFDQSLTVGLDVSGVDYSDSSAEVVFEGLTGLLVANSDQSAEIELSMGRLQAQQGNSQFGFTLDGLQLESTTEQINDLLAPGSAHLAIPAIQSLGPFPFNISAISADSRLQLSSMGAELLDIYQRLRIDSIESEFPLASLDWTSEVNEISTELIRSYYQLLADLQQQVNASQGTVKTQVTELGQQLAVIAIQNSLVFNNLIQANAYDGEHSVDLRIDWRGLPQLDDFAQLDINEAIAALTIDLELSLDLAAILRSPAADIIDPYVQQGYIVIDNGRILLSAALRDGELVLNGEAVPLDQFF